MTTPCIPPWNELSAQHGLPGDALDTTGYSWELLNEIAADHISRYSELKAAGDSIAAMLEAVPFVHSLKVRVKNPVHLSAKLVRKRIEGGEAVNRQTYTSAITDLVGVRALHLFKADWKPVHEHVAKTWDTAETPVAYFRKGDPEVVLTDFSSAGCKVAEHVFGYRSVHYLLRTQPAKVQILVELQVRTLFEEAWSEIDHRLRYPRVSNDGYLAEFLQILNRLAGSADEMSAFVQRLDIHLRAQVCALEAATGREQEAQSALATTIKKLKLTESQAAELRKSIDKLTSVAVPPSTTYTSLPTLLSPALNTTPYGLLGTLSAMTIRKCSRCGKTFSPNLSLFSATGDVCPNCQLGIAFGAPTLLGG